MEAIIRHSPITSNGPIYSTYGSSPYSVLVYCTCCGKGSKARSTAAHVDPTHRGTGGFCLPVLAPRHEQLRFPICTQKENKGGECLSFPSVSFKLRVAGFRNSSSRRVEGLPLFTAP